MNQKSEIITLNINDVVHFNKYIRNYKARGVETEHDI